MDFVKNIFLCFILCSMYEKLHSAKVYLIDVPTAEDINNNYDDYDIISNFDQDVREQNMLPTLHNKIIKIQRPFTACHRLFGSINGNRLRLKKCMESIHNAVRQEKRSTQEANYQFSDDYLDIKDLMRTNFSEDYADVDDFKFNVFPSFRKFFKGNLQLRAQDSSSDESSESSEEDIEGLRTRGRRGRRKKKKRYQVVTKQPKNNSVSSVSNEDNAILSEKEPKPFSDSSIENSIETTTRRPKRKGLKKEDSSKFRFLQGNKMYKPEDFRRRMPYFMPKRYHWREEEFHNLGYYWFNGPKGKYPYPELGTT